MNIRVSEYRYYCLHLVPKFGDVQDRQNWRMHPTAKVCSDDHLGLYSPQAIHYKRTDVLRPNLGEVSKPRDWLLLYTK